MTEIVPIAEHHVEAFVRETVANDAAQYVAIDGDRVVGWVDVLPRWAHAVAHVGSLGMGVLPANRGRGVGRPGCAGGVTAGW